MVIKEHILINSSAQLFNTLIVVEINIILTHKVQQIGYNPEIILAGRRLNDDMGIYVANQIIKLLIKKVKK